MIEDMRRVRAADRHESGWMDTANFNDPAIIRVWTDAERFAALVEVIRRFKPEYYVNRLIAEGAGYIMHTDATMHLTVHALEMTEDERRFVLPWHYDLA